MRAVQLNGEIITHDRLVVLPGATVPADAVDISINQSGEVLVKP